MLIAAIIFFASILLIAALFALKNWEIRREQTFVPALRSRADEGALELKVLIERGRVEASRIPPTLVYLSRIAVHEGALGMAALARLLERQAHNVADLVSHKHRFERREPRNEYLKQMGEYKNGSDTTSE